MPSFQKYLFIFIASLVSVSCNNNRRENYGTNGNGTLTLEIQTNPAFAEDSETVLFKNDSLKYIQILLNNYSGGDIPRDTFWFKKIVLTDKQFELLDSSLTNLCRQKIAHKTSTLKGVDGMTISSSLINNRDTNYISFWSPSQQEIALDIFFRIRFLQSYSLHFRIL
jgi:hypothetical protein